MAIAEVAFVIAAGWVAYTYLIYPLLVLMIPARSSVASSNQSPPSVSVVLSAYNEESDILARIENILSQDYPADRIQVFVGSDGSTDGTNEVLRSFQDHPQVNPYVFAENRGKASVLNDLVAASDGEILVFTDANTEFDVNNVSQLVAQFSDPSIGGVCGELLLYDPEPDKSDNQDSLYWRYERFLKRKESNLACLPGANGANYAIRRELFVPLAPETIVDDLVISCRVFLAGKSLVYDQTAVAREEQAPRVTAEFKRRVRIGCGNYQSLAWLLPVVRQAPPAFAFVFVSHKIMRWFVPHMMLLALLSSAFLAANSTLFSWLFAVQVLGYLLCLAVYLTRDRVGWPRWTMTIYFLVSMNVALAVGFVKYASNNAKPTWERTPR